jgi:YHS domain-containing protein
MKQASLVLLALLLTAATVFAQTPAPPLTKVEPKKVCMINERFMNNDQIPVEVNGKTYYGCCAMCKERLANDATKRVAVDPVSGKTVDKAKAVIGAASDGVVVYFESEKNLKKYNQQATK